MEFFNAEYVSDFATSASLFWGVVETDKRLETECIAAFQFENDAKLFSRFLNESGRKTTVVDLLSMHLAFEDNR